MKTPNLIACEKVIAIHILLNCFFRFALHTTLALPHLKLINYNNAPKSGTLRNINILLPCGGKQK